MSSLIVRIIFLAGLCCLVLSAPHPINVNAYVKVDGSEDFAMPMDVSIPIPVPQVNIAATHGGSAHEETLHNADKAIPLTKLLQGGRVCTISTPPEKGIDFKKAITKICCESKLVSGTLSQTSLSCRIQADGDSLEDKTRAWKTIAASHGAKEAECV